MSEKMKLAPSEITDAAILAKCKQAMNEWSAGLAFSLSRALGDESTLVKATMYHTYGLSLDSRWTHRAFTLEKQGTPVSSPKDISAYRLWDTAICGMDDDQEVELTDTCYREECDTCHGEGKVECPTCHGDKKVTCSNCNGAGETKCHTCWGKGVTSCDATWHRSTVQAGGGGVCPKCHGSGEMTCPKCHGNGTIRCSDCGGRGEVTCDTCDGSGIVECEDCEGRGWNPFEWVLHQEQMSDEFAKVWCDEGLPEHDEKLDSYEKYVARDLVDSEESEGARADQSLANGFDAPFWQELASDWKEQDAKLQMQDGDKEGDRFRYQHAQVKQFDAAVKYDYTYNGKNYTIWIDLSSNHLYEGPENGLMAEWSKEIAQGGDAAAEKGDTPEAMFNYTMACVISDQDADISIRANRFINRQGWYFRGAMALSMLIWWSGYCWLSQGSTKGLVAGIVAAAAFVGADWLSMRRTMWQLICGNVALLAAGLIGYVAAFGENGYANQAHQQFVMACSIAGGSLAMLLGHDFGLRLRFKGIAHKYLMIGLGAIAGWAASPAIKLGCSASGNAEVTSSIAIGLAIVLLAGAGWRTKGRLRIMDCGKWVDGMAPEKQRAFVGSFKEIKPTWLTQAVFGVLLAWIPVSLIMGFALPKPDATKAAPVGADGETNVVAVAVAETNVVTKAAPETNSVEESAGEKPAEATAPVVSEQTDDGNSQQAEAADTESEQAEAEAQKRKEAAEAEAQKRKEAAEAEALKRKEAAEAERKQAEAEALKRKEAAAAEALKRKEAAEAERKQAEAEALKRKEAAAAEAQKRKEAVEVAKRKPQSDESASKVDPATDLKTAAEDAVNSAKDAANATKDAASTLLKSLW